MGSAGGGEDSGRGHGRSQRCRDKQMVDRARPARNNIISFGLASTREIDSQEVESALYTQGLATCIEEHLKDILDQVRDQDRKQNPKKDDEDDDEERFEFEDEEA